MIKLAIAASDASLLAQAEILSQQLDLPIASLDFHEYSYLLVRTPERLELRKNTPQAPSPVYVDFIEGALGHRIKYGGGKGQLIAKAVGLNKIKNPYVLDVTAGLGRDAFVLANLGCRVLMLERSPIVAALLEDGLQRAREVEEFAQLDLQMRGCSGQKFKLLENLFKNQCHPGNERERVIRDPQKIESNGSRILRLSNARKLAKRV